MPKSVFLLGFFNEKLSKNQKFWKFFKWMIFTIFLGKLLFKNYQVEVFIQIEALLNQDQEFANCK